MLDFISCSAGKKSLAHPRQQDGGSALFTLCPVCLLADRQVPAVIQWMAPTDQLLLWLIKAEVVRHSKAAIGRLATGYILAKDQTQ